MSDISGENPNYTDDDLAILSSGAWNPGAETEIEAEPTPSAKPASPLQAPENPWSAPQEAEDYSTSHFESEPSEAKNSEEISRVELQPGGVKSAIEAILAVADTPVSVREFSAALIVSEQAVESALDDLYREYNGYDDGERVHEPRGFELRQLAGGWRLYSRVHFSPWVSRFVVGDSTAKLSKSQMETLTVVAYQQPATRNYVASVRGVNVDAAFRNLLKRGLIAETVPDPETGANQYVTTALFLEKLGLNSLEELPALAPFLPDIDDIELVTDNP